MAAPGPDAAAFARARSALARADELLALAELEEDRYRRRELEAGAQMCRELAEIHEAAAEAHRRGRFAGPLPA